MNRLRGALVCISAVALLAACGSSQHRGATTPPTSPKGGATTPHPSGAGRVYNVTDYGADPTGGKDSTLPIRKAIDAAQGAAGNTVYLPAGRYVLKNGDKAKVDFEIATRPVTIQGAGASRTAIVEESGAKGGLARGKGIFEILTGPGGVQGGADGTRISGLTLDSASFDAGTTILDYANNSTISNDVIHGPRSNHAYNKGQFGLRVITICNHDNLATKHRSNNTVENLVLTGQGSGGNTDLDISCQENASVSNVDDTGNGMDIYIVDGVHVNNFTHHNGGTAQSPISISLTAPTNNVTITNFTTYGSGGDLRPSPNGYQIANTTITNELMKTPGYSLRLGDAINTTITNSKLFTVNIAPAHAINGVKVVGSTVASTQCAGPGTVSVLFGVTC